MTAPTANPATKFIDPKALMNIRNLELRARWRCSAELHSAVSQVCNLRRAGITNPPLHFPRPAGCKPGTRQIENLRYGFGASPCHALLQRHCSGSPQSRASTGFLTV